LDRSSCWNWNTETLARICGTYSSCAGRAGQLFDQAFPIEYVLLPVEQRVLRMLWIERRQGVNKNQLPREQPVADVVRDRLIDVASICKPPVDVVVIFCQIEPDVLIEQVVPVSGAA
jgi:hypothetical protein